MGWILSIWDDSDLQNSKKASGMRIFQLLLSNAFVNQGRPRVKLITPPKINMEPGNDGFQ